MQDLFYPSDTSVIEPEPSDPRRPGFFVGLSDEAYHALFRAVLSKPQYTYTDILALLKTTKQEGKLMRTVMSHISQWVDGESVQVSDRDNNKPALCKGLVPALRRKHGDRADETSVLLQQEVLDYVRVTAHVWTSTDLEHYLREEPSADSGAYGARFHHKVWREVLSIVTRFTGPTWQDKGLARETQEETPTPRPAWVARTARNLICEIPEIANNPSLQSRTAAEELLEKMLPVIANWMSRDDTSKAAYIRDDAEESDSSSQYERLGTRHSKEEVDRRSAVKPSAPQSAARSGLQRSPLHSSPLELTSAAVPARGTPKAPSATQDEHEEDLATSTSGIQKSRKKPTKRGTARRQQDAEPVASSGMKPRHAGSWRDALEERK